MKNNPLSLWPLAFVLMLPLGVARSEAIRLPDLGSGSKAISPAEEKAVGRDAIRNLRRAGLLVEDPGVTAYVNNLGQQLAAVDDFPEPFHFFLVDDPAINAFALPGGYIGINAGLVTAAKSESELASVVAHEMAHVTQQHIARSIEAMNKLNAPVTAALVAAIVLGSQNPALAQAALASSLAGSMQSRLDFSRQYEQEADRVGMQTLTQAGFDPMGMASFFERLYQETRFSGGDAAELEFLRTHPVTTSRISDARGRAQQLTTRPSQRPTTAFDFFQAELRVRTSSEPAALARELEEAIQRSTGDVAALRYARARALLKAKRLKEARTELAKVGEPAGQRRRLISTHASIALAEGDQTEAATVLRQGLELYPRDPSLTLEYARLLVEQKKHSEAVTLLRSFVRDKNDYAEAYSLLAQAEAARGNQGAARLALAEHFALRDEHHLAIEQLQSAKRDAGIDFYDLARIEARLQELTGDSQ